MLRWGIQQVRSAMYEPLDFLASELGIVAPEWYVRWIVALDAKLSASLQVARSGETS